jgi:DNA-directed RNA polymerase specialized sigma24 family protein
LDLQRPRRSAEEIAALPPVGTTEWEVYVRGKASAFSPETLVRVIRQAAGLRNTALVEWLGHVLRGLPGPDGRWSGGYCDRIILAVAVRRRLHADRQLLHEFRENCHIAMWKAILAGWKKKPFWELRFGLVLKNACIDEARKLIRTLARVLPLSPHIADDRPSGSVDEEVWQRIVEEATEDAVRRLPPDQARVAFLSIVLRLPVESKVYPSVSKTLGITPRWAHELLGRAKASLKADPHLRRFLPREGT